jgi:hypothetical protein
MWFRLICVLVCLGVGWQGMACGPPCRVVPANLSMKGCLGEDTCTALQTDCQVRVECKQVFQYCQGYMVGGDLNMQCAGTDGHSFQAIAGVKEDGIVVTFVKDGKTCQGSWEAKQ